MRGAQRVVAMIALGLLLISSIAGADEPIAWVGDPDHPVAIGELAIGRTHAIDGHAGYDDATAGSARFAFAPDPRGPFIGLLLGADLACHHAADRFCTVDGLVGARLAMPITRAGAYVIFDAAGGVERGHAGLVGFGFVAGVGARQLVRWLEVGIQVDIATWAVTGAPSAYPDPSGSECKLYVVLGIHRGLADMRRRIGRWDATF
jgi:hypothetical protein